ncbi:MAG: hypothetical protein M0026_09025 [Nocardiopsaceae bacterium]|nr:hypothetical protein [Nocardiopsaceae bacterium]
MAPAENGNTRLNGHDDPPSNTRHPTGVRVTAAILGLACLILGPAGYLNALSAGPGAGEWYTLGFGASVGLPLLAAAITTVAGDRRAALWALALLAWPLLYIPAVHLLAPA